MCGFSGYIGKKHVTRERIDDAFSKMKRRGPDALGVCNYSLDNTNIYLLHSRLAIIDDDKRSNQPMESEKYSLVFNGEIYNYIELKNVLKGKGYKFYTESDTEVLFKMLIHYGDKAYDMLDGAWALAFFNKKNRTLTLSRDRFSEKPLYYLVDKDGYYFGSSPSYIQALFGKPLGVNFKKLERYIRYDFKSMYLDNETFIDDIKSIPSSTNFIISTDKSVKISKFFNSHKSIKFDSTESIVSAIRKSMIKSLKRRMRSDKPIAFLLSGGVDSSSLCYLASKELDKNITCFSVGSDDERYDESSNIDFTISDLGCEHSYVATDMDATEISSKMIEFSKEFMSPLPGQNYLLYSELNKLISEKGYSVVISGHGGDELFAGYFIHNNYYVKSLKGTSEFDNAVNYFKKNIRPQLRNKVLADIESFCEEDECVLSSFEEHKEIDCYFKKDIDLSMDTDHEVVGSDGFKKKLDEDLFYLTLPQHVVASDQVSMFYSLENRAPFLSKELYDIARSIPNELLIHNGYGKFILRKSMEGIVPDSVLWDKNKKGFNFEFSSKNIKDFLCLFSNIGGSKFFDNFIDKKKIERLTKKEKLSNAESKLLFRISNASCFLNSLSADS